MIRIRDVVLLAIRGGTVYLGIKVIFWIIQWINYFRNGYFFQPLSLWTHGYFFGIPLTLLITIVFMVRHSSRITDWILIYSKNEVPTDLWKIKYIYAISVGVMGFLLLLTIPAKLIAVGYSFLSLDNESFIFGVIVILFKAILGLLMLLRSTMIARFIPSWDSRIQEVNT